jgi:DNA modification methylase
VKVEPRSNTAIAAGLSSFGSKKVQLHHQGFDKARGATDGKKAKQKMRPKDRPLANDFVSDEEFDKMLRAWFNNAARVLKPGSSFYIWGGYANLENYPGPIKDAGLYFSQAIIWNKLHPVLTRKTYLSAFELCFYGWYRGKGKDGGCAKGGKGHRYFGKNQTDLWEVRKINPSAMVHLTEKPVELAVRCIQNSSQPGENVLDLFGGSGSTMIGCEQTDRHAFLMEIDELYCDVIVKRWEDFTGQKATRIAAGTSQATEVSE